MKERKDSTGETLPNLKPARSLVMIVFTNTIGEVETRILDTLYTI